MNVTTSSPLLKHSRVPDLHDRCLARADTIGVDSVVHDCYSVSDVFRKRLSLPCVVASSLSDELTANSKWAWRAVTPILERGSSLGNSGSKPTSLLLAHRNIPHTRDGVLPATLL
jgi:hypothetical protein